jgi:polyvinyl alcohol dehydrogenase (cytochrome)
MGKLRVRPRRIRLTAALVAVVVGALATAAIAGEKLGDWAMGGQNTSNTRSQDQSVVGAGNAGRLAVKWTAHLDGDVTATAAVDGGAVYVPDWGAQDAASGNAFSLGGSITKLNARTGAVVWTRKLGSYAGEDANAVSRTSPAVVDNVVYIGDQNGAHVLAIDAKTGNLIWRSAPINPGPFAIITQSPIVSNGVLYVGAASAEENVASFTGYPCCIARGSISALDVKTGAILWTTFMVPDNHGVPGGYSGGGVWGSTPALDEKSGTLFVSTGNNYSEPAAVAECEANGGTPGQCLSPDDHVDSIVALDAKTGAIKWATGVQGFDAWNVSCIFGDSTNCPSPTGPDFDFGSGPNLMTLKSGGKPRLVVGAGQKSGAYWLLDATTGQIIWGTQVGPGSSLGGIEWGTAAADGRIYVSLANLYQIPFTTAGGATINYGSYAALDAATGRILWQTPDPSHSPLDIGPVSVSNGVMYVGSMSGHMYALDASNGNVLWDFHGAGSSNAGPAIDTEGTLYWGNGYERFFFGAPSRTFYAFSLDGK